MEMVRTWAISLAVCSILLALVRFAAPEGGLHRIISFSGGLIFMLCMMAPLREKVTFHIPDMARIYEEAEEAERIVSERTEQSLQEGIELRTSSYIEQQAGLLGIKLRAEVTAEKREDGLLVPARAELWGPYSAELERMLGQELGIPAGRQSWHEG